MSVCVARDREDREAARELEGDDSELQSAR